MVFSFINMANNDSTPNINTKIGNKFQFDLSKSLDGIEDGFDLPKISDVQQLPNYQSSLSSKIITAIDLENNEKAIDSIVNERTVVFNRKRMRRELKQQKDLRKSEMLEELALAYVMPQDEIDAIKLKIINDEESKLFRANEYNAIKNQKENYVEMRKIIDGLNDMPFYGAEIEKFEIQTIDKFKQYDDLIVSNIGHIEYFNNIKKEVKLRIAKHIKSLVDTKSNTNDSILLSLESIFKMREMYTVTTEVDDIEIFERYDLKTNIDIAHEMSESLFKRVASGDKTNNAINEFSPRFGAIKLLANLVQQQIISNTMLAILFSDKFITNNSITTHETMYVNNQSIFNADNPNTNNPDKYSLLYRTRTLGELLLEITNIEISEQAKVDRQQIYMTYDGFRPSMDEYYKWNGLQVFDIDLKDWKKMGGNIEVLKTKIHELMIDFHWYLWICKSASGNGLHIYTKVTPPHHVYTTASDNDYICKYWHQVNYATKVSNLHDILGRLSIINGNGIMFDNSVFENQYVDNVVNRITAGIRLAYDPHPLVNHNFVDLHVGMYLSQTLDGYQEQATIDRVLLRSTKIIQNINDNLVIESPIDSVFNKNDDVIDLSKFIHLGNDLTTLSPINGINYNTRYNVCNSLAAIFGKDGLPIAHKILDSTKHKNIGEINSFYSCAISNRKEPSKFGLEILKKAGIIRSIEPEVTEIVETGFKQEFSKQILKSIQNTKTEVTFNLTSREYISDYQDQLIHLITGERINIILSPPGSGKTEFIKQLARDGKRILLVLPYISVIKNKIENDPSITKDFDVFYGTKDIKDISYGRNAVTTFDKFSRSNFEKLSKMFDYIMLDESHLLFTSSYRIEATSNVIKKIKELYFISSNDPFAAKICLLTGTETGETSFFSQVANIIRIAKPQHDKNMEFLICGDMLDAITRLAAKAADLLNARYKLLIPTNKGEIYSEKIIGMIEYLLQRPVKYGYYKRSNTEQEICQLINNHNSLGDYDIVFCSNYLSVGVDINDKLHEDGALIKFASLYMGNFSGYEIEQFNARIRKAGIRSIYCVSTNTADGTTNELLLQEPNLLLKITDEDQLYFIDDKALASAKTEFIASYDPILHRIVTPGFSLLNGKILFNLEEYELMSFENKYSVCMEHPIKVARELSKYGYKINVSTEFEGLAVSEQAMLKKMGINAAKEEKVRKHNLLVGTYIDLVQQNTYSNEHGLEFNNVIEWIGKNSDLVIEDRELTRTNANNEIEPCFVQVIFDIFASPKSVIVRSREALEKMYSPAKYLIKRYATNKAMEIIYKYVDDNGILKQKLFTRSINLLKLIDSSEANELADPITRTLEKMYSFVDQFELSKEFKIGYETHQSIVDNWVNEYIDYLGIKINTKYGFDKIRDSITEMLADIATKTTSKGGIRFTYNKMPDADSTLVLNRRSIDGIIQNMFNLHENLIVNKNKSREKHIILATQMF